MKKLVIKTNKYFLTICLGIALCLLTFTKASSIDFNGINSLPPNMPVVVSLGDSYSSGEGNPPYCDTRFTNAQKVQSYDWLAHRSENSWPSQLSLNGITFKTVKNIRWYFVASSGATTEHLYNPQEKKYYRGPTSDAGNIYRSYDLQNGSKDLKPQLSIFEELNSKNQKADYVTITLGGNDANFADIVTEGFLEGYIVFGNVQKKLAKTWGDFYKQNGIRDNIREAYRNIRNAAGDQAKIIVAGYPTLINTEGGGGFSTETAVAINNAVSQFNKELRGIVTECQAAKINIHFVSVEEEFKGHEAYTDTPYIHEVMLGPGREELNEISVKNSGSIHPNENGMEVYRECVQNKIEELEKNGSNLPIRTTSDERDIVLVLDRSGSMDGEPLEETKKASSNFISTILKEDASIGIVTYDNSASMHSDFSIDENNLKAVADNITSGGGTSIEAGLIKAKEMLDTSSAKKKIIVLMSDGEPNDGKVGEDLISYAENLKSEGIYIYTLGFFKNIGSNKSSAQILMERMASEGCHYEVSNADDLVFFFGDIADQINGQKYIYVRIACPVDVNVTNGDETLSSVENDITTRTSFGTLTFEENPNKSADSTDDRIKILRLKDGADYDVKIAGNGTGKMNYTIRLMDDTGEYADLREFKDIEISGKTQIDTVAKNSSSTTLNVDSDGDGRYDLKYKAAANSIGEIVDYTYIYCIGAVVILLIIILILYIKIKKWRKKRAEAKQRELASQKKFCTHCGATMSGEKNFCTKCGNMIE